MHPFIFAITPSTCCGYQQNNKVGYKHRSGEVDSSVANLLQYLSNRIVL